MIYNDYDSSFNELLEMANENTIHIKNMHILIMTDIFKLLSGLSPPIISQIFKKKDCPYPLRNSGTLMTNFKATVNVIDSILYKGPQIWQTFPTDLKNLESLTINFPCKICKTLHMKYGI